MSISDEPFRVSVVGSLLMTDPTTVPPALPVISTLLAMIDPFTVPNEPLNWTRYPGARMNDPVSCRSAPYEAGSDSTPRADTLPEKFRTLADPLNVTPFSTTMTPWMSVLPRNSMLFGALTYSTPRIV